MDRIKRSSRSTRAFQWLAAGTLSGALPGWAQCVNPVAGDCTVPAGTILSATTASPVAVDVQAGGNATANGITVNLLNPGTGAISVTGGGRASFDGSTVQTTALGAQAAGQYGFRVSGLGSLLSAANATVKLQPTNTAVAANLNGVLVSDQARAVFTGSTVLVNGNGNATGIRGVVASGAGSSIQFSGGSITTASRGAIAVQAEAGGTVTLDQGATVSTSGAQTTTTPVVAGHGLFATGAGSQIIGNGITVTAGATLANAARAESGASLSLTNSTLNGTGAGNAANASGAVRVLSGSSGVLVGTTATGGDVNYAHGASVEDAGSRLDVSAASTLEATGARSFGLLAANGGVALVQDSTIKSAKSHAVQVTGADSRVELTSVSVQASPATGSGVRVEAASSAALTNGSVTTLGINAPGLLAANATATSTGTAYVTSGDGNSMGVLADLNGSIQLTNGSVATTGNDDGQGRRAIGLVARNPGAVLTATGTTITTSGTEAMAVNADDGGSVQLRGTRITTQERTALGLFTVVEQAGAQFPASIAATQASIETFGPNAWGAAVQQSFDAPARVSLEQSTVTTHGDGAVGLRANWVTRSSAPTPGGGAVLTATGSSVTTSGAAAHGAVALNPSASIELSQSSVATSGAAAHGAVVVDGGAISATSSTVAASGENASALFATGLPGIEGRASSATFTGSQLSNRGGPTIGVSGAAVVTLTNTTVSGSGLWLRVGPASDFPPLAADVPLTGVPDLVDGTPPAGPDTTVLSKGQLRLAAPGATTDSAYILASGSTLTGAATTADGVTSNVSLNAGSTWNLTGNSNLTNLSNTGSQILFSAPVAGVFKTLTVANYAGGAGSVIGLNTYLGADGSPSDKLVVNGGAATGNSGLRFTNAGGPGAVTSSNGILVVDATGGATTAGAAFSMVGRTVQGPYEYRLYRGSTDGTNPEAWYLRSEQTPPTPPAPPVPPVPPPPAPPTPPSPPVPLYRPEVGAYLANQYLSAAMFVHSLHDRLGEPQAIEYQAFEKPDDKRRSAWLRVVGKSIDSTSRGGVFDVDSRQWLIQGGGDIANWSVAKDKSAVPADRLHLGAMLGYGSASTDATAAGNPALASSETKGTSLGAYATWYQNDENKLGWYTDLWGTYGWFSNEVTGQLLDAVKYDSKVLTLSAELGYAFRVRDDSDWILEPQGQLIYVRNSIDDLVEPNGTRVAANDGNGWISRLGLRVHRTWVSDEGRRTQPYLTVNWWHSSVEDAVAFNNVALGRLYPDDRYEVKLGLNVERGRGWTGWGNLGYQWGSQSYRAFAARVGAKYTW